MIHSDLYNSYTLKNTEKMVVPSGAINFSNADSSSSKYLAYVRFQLKLGAITLPVEPFVSRSLGPVIMLLDDTTMSASGAVLDWSTEHLTFKNSQVKHKASHRKVTPPGESCNNSVLCGYH